ncbi:hypothetical protein BT63DRAFT_453991 [Microthyrium microscopicum]|uniref:Prion-inhibition and propagation HeLo domain-containing protein n=1 Tax=Microthyrium microscopicum TaxID=703497 RepID=A0A6A6UFD8_9PEZI|nr:hypothetical protein BT63DRAFT_453991 [Microthyrium microscopicum]
MYNPAGADIIAPLASLFKDVVDCFDNIRLARNFEEDFDVHKLQLEIAQFRLARWGESVGFALEDLSDLYDCFKVREADLAYDILTKIVLQLKEAFNTASGYESRIEERSTSRELCGREYVEDNDEMAELHRKIRRQAISLPSQSPGSFVRGLGLASRWALYEPQHLTTLIGTVTCFIKELEDIFDMKEQQSVLCKKIAAELLSCGHEAQSLVREVAAEQDKPLRDVLGKGILSVSTRRSTRLASGSNAGAKSLLRNVRFSLP